MLLLVDEIERLVKQISPGNERLTNITVANQIIDKMEVHFETIKGKLKSSELSAFNFSLAEIQNIVPAKIDRFTVPLYTEQESLPVFKALIHHIRRINSLFKTLHYR